MATTAKTKAACPYWLAVREGKSEHWYARSGQILTCFRMLSEIYRSDCRRRTSEGALRRQGWMPASEYFAPVVKTLRCEGCGYKWDYSVPNNTPLGPLKIICPECREGYGWAETH